MPGWALKETRVERMLASLPAMVSLGCRNSPRRLGATCPHPPVRGFGGKVGQSASVRGRVPEPVQVCLTEGGGGGKCADKADGAGAGRAPSLSASNLGQGDLVALHG